MRKREREDKWERNQNTPSREEGRDVSALRGGKQTEHKSERASVREREREGRSERAKERKERVAASGGTGRVARNQTRKWEWAARRGLGLQEPITGLTVSQPGERK